MEWIWHVMDRSISAVCALICIQIPSFFVQYMQRLSGHIQELQRQLSTLRHLAEGSGRTLTQYIEKFLHQSDHDFSGQGLWMQGLVQRHSGLSQSWQALQEADAWHRPFVFLSEMDRNIAFGTMGEFQPAIAMSIEGLLYAFIGVLIGSFFVFCIRGMWRLCKRLFGVFSVSS